MARLGRARTKRIDNASFLIQTGTVALAASSSLTTAGVPERTAAVALASDSSLTASGTRTAPATASLTAAATLTISGSPGSVTLAAAATLTVTGVGETTADALALTADSTLTLISAESGVLALAGDSTLTITGIPIAVAAAILSATTRLTVPGRQGIAALTATSFLIATGVAPTRAPLLFLDMSVSVTPPNGHFEPVPVTLGTDWQPGDIRLLFVSGSSEAYNQGDLSSEVPLSMNPDPPTGFTAAYALDLGLETRGVYYRRLVAGDADTSVSWAKPTAWRDFMFATLTVRGVSPTSVPIAGNLPISHTGPDPTVAVGPAVVPAAGTMVFCLGTITDSGQRWPGWAASTGVPTGWTALTATDKSGATFFPYGTDPSLNVVGNKYSSSGTTGTISFPVTPGSPTFVGMYVFLRPGDDVSIPVGAA